MKNRVIDIVLEDRACENCSGDNLEGLWTYERVAKSRTKKWSFSVNNCICKTCGFVFLSPVYTENSLSEYYADAMTYFQNDYSVDKRLSVVRRYADKNGTYLELGAKQKTEVHEFLEPYFSEILTLGIEDTSDCDIKDMQSISNGSVDVLTHYFVLEHVPKIKAFILSCWKALKLGGVMVVEVPDLNKYPHDIAALMLYEHTNHFSIQSLEQICCQLGFELIEEDLENASRSFGMVAVFRKIQPKYETTLSFKTEAYRVNKEVFLGGVKRVDAYLELLGRTRDELSAWLNQGDKVIVWGANDILATLFTDASLLNHVVIVDSDPRKENYMDNQTVHTPEMASHEIIAADAIIICTGQWSDEILDFMKKEFDKEFEPKSIRIVDYYFD